MDIFYTALVNNFEQLNAKAAEALNCKWVIKYSDTYLDIKLVIFFYLY